MTWFWYIFGSVLLGNILYILDIPTIIKYCVIFGYCILYLDFDLMKKDKEKIG